MADKKISQLTTLAQADVAVTADFLPIVDTSATETKKATPQALVQAGATGATLAPAALSISGGTASGVLYLNGSKVATSGSALVFDGTNLGVGITPSYRLDVSYDANATSAVRVVNINAGTSATSTLRLETAGNTWTVNSGRNGGFLSFNDAGGERARFDNAGNLGIGTASPAQRLDVNGVARVSTEIRVKNTVGNVSYLTFEENATSTSYTFISGDARTSGYMGFWTNNTERMRLTAAGDLGIGTASPTSKVEVYGGAAGTSTNLTVGNANTAFLFGVDTGNNCQIRTAQNVPMIFYTNATNRGGVDGAGNWTLGGGTLATSATDGFFYVPTCAGTPTGTPTTKTGFAPIVVNTTNNKLYFYSGGAWRDAGP